MATSGNTITTQQPSKELDAVYFESLYRAHWSKLYRYCLSYVHNQAVAEEIIQSVFESLWQRKDKMAIDTATVEGYLFRAVKLKIFDYHRQLASRKKHEDSLTAIPSNDRNDTEEHCYFLELSAHVEALVDQLPGRCQQVYKLNIEEGYSYREVANTMDISIHTVKEHLIRARHYLLKKLRKHYGETFYLQNR